MDFIKRHSASIIGVSAIFGFIIAGSVGTVMWQ